MLLMYRHLQWHACLLHERHCLNAKTKPALGILMLLWTKASRRGHMHSPWSRFSILLLPGPGPVLWLRSSDSLISGETATFQSYRSSPAHLSSLGNIKHLFVLTNRSGDVPEVPLDSLSASRWSWVLPISPRTDYCLTFVNPKTDKAQYIIVCCGVTSVGWQTLIRKMPKHTYILLLPTQSGADRIGPSRRGQGKM